MVRTQTMVQLSEDLVATLDEVAGRRGLSRSALIREILAEKLADDDEARIGRLIAEGYRRVPPGQPDDWGLLEEQSEQLSTAAKARLDDDERAAGAPGW